MSAAETELNAEIARLEAELEETKLKSKLRQLKAQLGQDVDDDDAIEDEEELSYEEYECADDGDDFVVEEYEDEEYEEYEEVEEYEEYEEYVEEEYVEADPAQDRPVTTQSPFGATLRKAPTSSYQQREAAKVSQQAPVYLPEPAVPTPAPAPAPEAPVEAPRSGGLSKKKGKSKIRPKGSKPKPRIDPSETAPKSKKFNPLGRLLDRNTRSYTVGNKPPPPGLAEKAASEANPNITTRAVTPNGTLKKSTIQPKATGTGEFKRKIIRTRIVKRRVPKQPGGTSTPQNQQGGGVVKKKQPIKKKTVLSPGQRRLIPNVQPSPAGQETIFEQLLGPKLLSDGKMNKCGTLGCVRDQELIVLYFAAKWPTNCKKFHPLLNDFYRSVAHQQNLEVVYVSADRSLMEFKDIFTTMPYLAMPAGTAKYKNDLAQRLKVIDMPAVVVLDDDGNVVTVEGVSKIQELEKGNVVQANQLCDRWKKTRPIPMDDVQLDNTLLHGKIERGFLYWNS